MVIFKPPKISIEMVLTNKWHKAGWNDAIREAIKIVDNADWRMGRSRQEIKDLIINLLATELEKLKVK